MSPFPPTHRRLRRRSNESTNTAHIRRTEETVAYNRLHIIPLCAMAFFLKNIDSPNVSTVRIMNKGSSQNILAQLGMTSDEFNFVSTIYYVRAQNIDCKDGHADILPDSIHRRRSTIQPFVKRMLPSRWQSRIMVSSFFSPPQTLY